MQIGGMGGGSWRIWLDAGRDGSRGRWVGGAGGWFLGDMAGGGRRLLYKEAGFMVLGHSYIFLRRNLGCSRGRLFSGG